MTYDYNTYTVALSENTAVPAIVQLIQLEDDIRDLGFVGGETIHVAKDDVPASGGPLTLSLTCNAAFAAEIENTVGVAAVQKKIAATPAYTL